MTAQRGTIYLTHDWQTDQCVLVLLAVVRVVHFVRSTLIQVIIVLRIDQSQASCKERGKKQQKQ